MSYLLGTVLAIAILFCIAYIISRVIKVVHKILFTIFVGCLLIVAVGIGYLQFYYHAEDDALEYLKSGDAVKITKTDDYYFFDGSGTNSAYIFYPGAKVDERSYAPLMHKIAAGGVDCYLVRMPMHFAFFGAHKAENIIKKIKCDNIYIGGHSLGGSVACGYASVRPKKIDGVILLASYPFTKLGKNTRLLTIYGSEDGFLDMDIYEKQKSNFPKNFTEVVIKGGNHSQFGDYGLQKEDKKAKIPMDKQMRKTVSSIKDFCD